MSTYFYRNIVVRDPLAFFINTNIKAINFTPIGRHKSTTAKPNRPLLPQPSPMSHLFFSTKLNRSMTKVWTKEKKRGRGRN